MRWKQGRETFGFQAGPAVRHKCLRALLRMVYFAPAELLRRILKHQPVSSHVAAMLASQDLRVVVAALQMAEILMQKLPDVFGVYFRREGVMHQIRWLARMELPAVIWSPPPEEDHYLSLGQVRLSDVLKRKRTPKRGNSTNRKVRTEEASASLEASASVSASPVLLPSTSGRGCSSSGGGNKIAAKTNSLLSNLNPSRWARWSSSPLRASAPPPPDAAKAAVAGNKDKIRAWIKERAGKLEEMYFSTDHREGTSHPAMSIFNKLLTALSHLDSAVSSNFIEFLLYRDNTNVLFQTDGGLKALEEMRSVVMESDISSFELNHSGLITKLLAFLTTADPDRENRLRIFLNVFLNAPLIQICSGPLDLKPGPFSQLVAKLNACLSQLEQFSVKVHDLPGSASGSGSRPGTSALKFFNTHQLKCNLQRHPSCSNLRQWRGGPVKIDPLALVQAIERYLVIRGYGRLKDDDDEASDDDNSDEDIDDTMAAMMINQGQGKHKLQFLIGEHVLPYNMTVYQAIRQFAASDGVPDGQETDIDSDNPLGSTNIWIQTHVIWYRPVASEETDTPPSASKRWSGSSRRSNKGGRTSPKKKSSDDLWNEGIVPEILSPLIPYLSGSLPESVTHRDQSLEVITLLRVLYGLSSYWGSLYDVSKQVPALSPIEFVNPKLTGKANRQLQDPLAIMTGNVPSWLAQIAYACPFLFPFETRHLLFYVTSFDRDRALQRLLDMSPELSSQDSSERVTPRLERRKRTVSREELLKQAESVLQDLGNSKALLEIQYDGEVGTGLGPTLEFYALVSRELQRSELDIWRGSTTGNYVIPLAPGLFPLPLSRNSKPAHVARVRSRFKLLGRFLAKALMDSRVVDIGLSPAFYSWLLGQEATLGPKEMALVDPEFAQTLRHLEEVALIKQRLEQDKSQTPTSLKSALDNLKLDGQPIDALGLDFTLPGTPNLELQRGGRDMGVSAHNVDRYVKLVAHWSLVEGVRRQMEAFREGFESIFPLVQLGLFYPYELDQLFCGSAHAQWDLKTLAECCRPDHGYLPDSRAIRFLFHILSNQTPEEQRHFLQFVTGSPRLPVGGLKSLTPPLTIVRKTLDASDDPDDYLPSVMTCVNYLKLPDYSSIEKMREKLNIAVFEGQHSFHLS
ncbi:hypothetical protein LAZ67_3005823 [Cordylochernes scorpioides]|uniref:E3 ubiquitin-protein ligase n=1 Tax=Cordylochernes scorpioides TaxID=51811 RepID=A0ABY6KB04_9ARAC|nr:hypothetical protein LAZ67_3005823 [Cordylochernes scorpioides]